MKKIYFSILTCTMALISNAQLSLTKSFNEPVVGNANVRLEFDTVVAVPKNTGANQTWDFSGFQTNNAYTTTTYTTVASTPNGSVFTTANLADDDGGGTYNYYKTTPTQFELVGIDDPNVVLNFTNTAIAAIWPITMGYSNTDAFSGSAAAQGQTGTANGTVTTAAVGNGTLMLPGATTLTNILQIKTNQTINVSLTFGFVTATVTATQYDYYHGSQKFPIVTLSYNDIQGAFTGSQATLKMNNAVVLGITDNNFEATFNIFPNPAKDKFVVSLTNLNNDKSSIEVINAVGAIVKTVDLGNSSKIYDAISITDLPSGIYMVKTTLGNKVSVRKLVIE